MSRGAIHGPVETDLLIASRRRCCLCVFLEGQRETKKGQIAHINHDPGDGRFDNLVWLCLEHHDQYDGRTSQSKGLTSDEVRSYRNKLYAENDPDGRWRTQTVAPSNQDDGVSLRSLSQYEMIRSNFPEKLRFTAKPWRFPLWLVANQPDLFAYKAANDGICLIERIDLPDGRIVVVCIDVTGNPGMSVTNCVEDLCFQVCERFAIPADRLVWLEHYDYDFGYGAEWNMVVFGRMPPEPFGDPKWIKMTPQLWRQLRLRPKKRLSRERGTFGSKVTKLFPWPTEGIH